MKSLGKPLTLHHGTLGFSAWVSDNTSGDWVVLLHGFPDGPETWRSQVPALSAAGYRVAVLTSRGYEPSSQPSDGDYQVVSLADDFPAWLESLGASSAHLVGHDWGATIAYAIAVTYPDLVKSLSCLAVPHPGRLAQALSSDFSQLWRSRYIIGFQMAGWAEKRIARNNFRYIEKLWRRWSPGWEPPEDLLAAVKARLAQPGVIDATLRYYRQGADVKTDAGKASRALAIRPVPVATLGIIGDNDNCISSKVFVESMQADDFPGGLKVARVQDAGHFLHLEQPEAVNALLIDWLETN